MTFLEWLHNKSMCKGKSHLKLDFLTKNFLGEDTINKHFIWTPSKKIKENVKPGNFNMNPSMTFGGCFWGPLTSEWKATHLLSNCWCCNIISLTRLLKWFLIRVSLVSLSLAPLVTWSSCPSCPKSNKHSLLPVSNYKHRWIKPFYYQYCIPLAAKKMICFTIY